VESAVAAGLVAPGQGPAQGRAVWPGVAVAQSQAQAARARDASAW